MIPFKKLIRKKVAEDHLSRDEASVIILKTAKEKRAALAEKILEEAQEVADELLKDRIVKKNLTEELADVCEVLYTICLELNISDIKLQNIQDDKYELKGGFEDFYYKVQKT